MSRPKTLQDDHGVRIPDFSLWSSARNTYVHLGGNTFIHWCLINVVYDHGNSFCTKCRSCEHSSAYIFNPIFFILSRNKENYEILDEFDIRRDSTMDCGVSCP